MSSLTLKQLADLELVAAKQAAASRSLEREGAFCADIPDRPDCCAKSGDHH